MEPYSFSGTAVVSAIAGAVTTTVKLAEKIYEIVGVGEQANSLLATIKQVDEQLDYAKTLRHQKSHLFSSLEVSTIDRIFANTEAALRDVAKHVERARADMQVSGDRLRLNTRLLFVLRDSPHIHVSLTQLGIANQHLSGAVVTLCSRQGLQTVQNSVVGGQLASAEPKPPPSYDESQMLVQHRNRNFKKRASVSSLKPTVQVATQQVSPVAENESRYYSPLQQTQSRVSLNSMTDSLECDTGLIAFDSLQPSKSHTDLVNVGRSFEYDTTPIVVSASLRSSDSQFDLSRTPPSFTYDSTAIVASDSLQRSASEPSLSGEVQSSEYHTMPIVVSSSRRESQLNDSTSSTGQVFEFDTTPLLASELSRGQQQMEACYGHRPNQYSKGRARNRMWMQALCEE